MFKGQVGGVSSSTRSDDVFAHGHWSAKEMRGGGDGGDHQQMVMSSHLPIMAVDAKIQSTGVANVVAAILPPHCGLAGAAVGAAQQ